MSLRAKMARTATRLIGKYGDNVGAVTIAMVHGSDEFSPPTYTTDTVDVKAVVTGAEKWSDGETILATDLSVLVSGEAAQSEVGNQMNIDGDEYTIIQKHKILAAGIPSAIRYFVRRG